MARDKVVLVHLASGIGNIVLATPLLLIVSRDYIVDAIIDGDYVDTAELFVGWGALRRVYNGAKGERPHSNYDHVIPAIPPFYWDRYRRRYGATSNCVSRPCDSLFYKDEQEYYLEFARRLGCDTSNPSYYFLPCPPVSHYGIAATTVVLAPGSKTGEMAFKRWPYFPSLAERFEDVAVIGTADDLYRNDASKITFPNHVRVLTGRLSIRETAEALATAGAVVANDSGLGHIAGATGVSTILLFGPTPDRSLGRFPPNVKIIRAAMSCSPCWFGARFSACSHRIECLDRISVETVARELRSVLHA
jgi:ADP-heptose:LPS heptosyltransferase